MDTKQHGEIPPEEKIKQEMKERLITIIDRPDQRIDYNDFRLLKELGETNLASLFKILFDETFKLLKEALDEGSMGAITSYIGHQGVHAADMYEQYGNTIPETETETHKRGREIVLLKNIIRMEVLEAIKGLKSIDRQEQAKKLEETFEEACALDPEELSYLNDNPDVYQRSIKGLIRNSDKQKMRIFSKECDKLAKDELERVIVMFSQPLLTPEETNQAIQEIKEKAKKLLEQIK